MLWRYAPDWPGHEVEVLPVERETIARVRFINGAEAWVYKHELEPVASVVSPLSTPDPDGKP